MRFVLALLLALAPSLAIAQALPSPRLVTRPANDNSTFAATTAYVDGSAQALIGSLSGMSVTPSGGIARSLAALFANEIYAANYGVVGGTGADQGPALRLALAAAQAVNGTLVLPPGVITIAPDPSDTDALLRITALVNIRGASRSTALSPTAAAGTRAVLLVKPTANGGGIRGMVLRDFAIGTPLGAIRSGGDGIRLDTTNTNGFIAKPLIENVQIADAGAGIYAIHHVNTVAANVTGGLFGATIRESDLFGGTKFENTGDSNNLERNIITGANRGIEVALISGAATFRIEGNNITSSGGSVAVRGGTQVKIVRNQLEQPFAFTGTAGEEALVVLDGSVDCEIDGNNANAYDRVSVALFKNGATRNRLGPNSVIYSASNFLAKLVGAPNNTIAPQISDLINIGGTSVGAARGVPLISADTASLPVRGSNGVWSTLTLSSSWVAGTDANYDQGVQVRVAEGRVWLRGTIKGGTSAVNDPVAQLLGGMYPAKAKRLDVDVLTASGWQRGVLYVDTVGTIRVSAQGSGAFPTPLAGATVQIQFNDVSFTLD